MACIKKRVLSAILVILVMILALSPMIATPAFAADEDYGLLFNVADGKFYLDVNLDFIPVLGNEYTGQVGAWSWDSVTSTLALNGFSWTTSAPTALKILGNVTIDLTNANFFVSTYDGSVSGVDSNGISADYTATANSIIQGSGSLTAAGGQVRNSTSTGINAALANMTIKSGTVTATGGAVLAGSAANRSVGIRASTININGGTVTATGGTASGNGYAPFGGSDSWGIWAGFKIYVFDGIVTAIGGEAVGTMTSSAGIYGSAEVVGGTLTAIGGDAIGDGTSSVGFHTYEVGVYGGILAAQGKTAAIELYSVQRIILPAVYRWWTSETLPYIPAGTGTGSADAAYTYSASGRFVKVITITTRFNTLDVNAGAGGTVSGTASGVYEAGIAVSVTATANAGYHFTGWTVNGATIAGGNNSNPATFSMPAAAATITANFEKNTTTTGASTGGSAIPLTGDTNQSILLWSGAMLTVLGGAVLWRYRRRWINS